MERVDYHVHFDTRDSARAAIVEAKKKKVVSMGLLQRVQVSMWLPDLVRWGSEEGVEVVPGVEYVAVMGNGTRVDLVALGFDPENGELRKVLGEENMVERNQQIAKKQMEFLQSQGFDLSGLEGEDQNLLRVLMAGKVAEKAINFCRLAVAGKGNAELILTYKSANQRVWEEVKNKYGHSVVFQNAPGELEAKFLYRVLFSVGAPGFLQVQRGAGEFINLIHRAGGVVLYSPEGRFEGDIWRRLTDEGVDGIMSWHGERMEISKEVVLEARAKGLLVLGGSDFDPKNGDWEIGTGDRGQMFISPRRREDLMRRLAQVRSALTV